jgi:ribosomal protein S17E
MVLKEVPKEDLWKDDLTQKFEENRKNLDELTEKAQN